MNSLAQKYHSNTKLINLGDNVENMIDSLLNSKLILIAYDCDFNFEPCFKRGQKAHWALITGYLLPVQTSHLESLNIVYYEEE